MSRSGGRAKIVGASGYKEFNPKLYEQEYANAWDEFLEDLEFASFPTIGETTEALRIVASATSPCSSPASSPGTTTRSSRRCT